MAYDIRLVKLVSGEMILGKFDAEKNVYNDPAILQIVPTQQGSMQMMLVPFGYPFDQDFTGFISHDHVIFTYTACPEDLKTKYMEAFSNLSLSSKGLGGLDLKNPPSGGVPGGLLRGK